MITTLTGNIYTTSPSNLSPFGEKIFGGEYDRPNVPNSMIVITGAVSSDNVRIAADQLRLAGVQIFAIGFPDLPVVQLQAFSGNPATAFSINYENVANIIKTICTGI